MRKIFVMILTALLLNTPLAHAYQVNATLTADNHYGLYYGNATGSSLSLVGRNEFGPAGAPGIYNWSMPESYSFDTFGNNYLYVLAWDDKTVAQSWIGQFSGAEIGTIYSNTKDWEYVVAEGPNPGDFGNLPLLSIVQNDIATAQWNQPLVSGPNGTGPWGMIPGISPSADFIWNDTFAQSTNSHNHYDIFRTKLETSTVPEPITVLLFGLGLVGILFLNKNNRLSRVNA